MQEDTVSTTKDLFNACNVLFGTDVKVSLNFLRYLQLSGLKAAYRKRAFETHPDRATTLAESPLSLEERFKEINLAYRQLSMFVEYPWKYSLRDHTFRKTTEPGSTGRKRKSYGAQDQRRPGNDRHQSRFHGLDKQFWPGNIPGRKLLLGRFLYYSGVISMSTLVEAIVWQKRQRPMIGSIAINWDWLAQDDIRSILARRRPGEKFCECALRCGYIRRYQQNLLLVRQQMLQPRIGSFFVKHNIVTSYEMECIIEKLRLHNRKFRRT